MWVYRRCQMPHNYLHEHQDYKDLIQAVADQKGITPDLIEKDYWIMHCLYGLSKQGYQFELKGGTSLSKGFGIIHRFSDFYSAHWEESVYSTGLIIS